MTKQSCGRFNVPSNKLIDFKLLFGASIFGLGWGLGGLCPGQSILFQLFVFILRYTYHLTHQYVIFV